MYEDGQGWPDILHLPHRRTVFFLWTVENEINERLVCRLMIEALFDQGAFNDPPITGDLRLSLMTRKDLNRTHGHGVLLSEAVNPSD